MSARTALLAPLQGKTSLSRVFWLYGVLGYLLVSLVGLAVDSLGERSRRAYVVVGFLFSLYVTIATYRCAANCRSPAVARLARISALLSLPLLPLFAYLDYTGALELALPGE